MLRLKSWLNHLQMPQQTQEIITTQISWAKWTIVLHFSTFWRQFKISHTFLYMMSPIAWATCGLINWRKLKDVFAFFSGMVKWAYKYHVKRHYTFSYIYLKVSTNVCTSTLWAWSVCSWVSLCSKSLKHENFMKVTIYWWGWWWWW